MKRLLSLHGLAALIAWTLAAPALAEPVTLHYRASWAGLPAADIHLQLDEAGRAYRSRIDIRTEGLPKLLSRFRARAESAGSLSPGRSVVSVHPERHDAFYDLRSRKDKRTSLRFHAGPAGPIAVRGPGDTSSKPPPDEAVRRGVIDPLSALTAIRAEAARGALRRGETATVSVFDGKRRFDIVASVDPTGPRVWPGTTVPTLPLTLVLQPVAGFDDPDEDPDDHPQTTSLLLTDDVRLLPLEVRLTIAGLPARVTLAGVCAAATPCRVTFPDATLAGAS